MRTDEQLIERVRAALERETAEVVPPTDLLANIHEELRSSPAAERHRWRASSGGFRLRLAHLAPVAALLVVVAVVAVFLGVHGQKPAGSVAAHGGFTLVFRARPAAQVPVNQATMAHVVSILRRRIAAVVPSGKSTIAVTSVGGTIFVHAGSRNRISQQQLISLVGTTARLVFYDWEANALTPTGRTVASLLLTRDPAAVAISQGGAQWPPGTAGAGSMPLYRAVQLAEKQPYSASKDNARTGPEYFAFGAPGSTACTTAARDQHTVPFVGQHCYLAGPADNLEDLYASLPTTVSASEAQVLAVQRGTVVLQAVPAGGLGLASGHGPAWSDPTAQFYVLRDHASLFGTDLTNPHQSTDLTGRPDVTFGFNSRGQSCVRSRQQPSGGCHLRPGAGAGGSPIALAS